MIGVAMIGAEGFYPDHPWRKKNTTTKSITNDEHNPVRRRWHHEPHLFVADPNERLLVDHR